MTDRPTNRAEPGISQLASSYLLLFPLLFLIARAGSFSFQTGGLNSDLGSTYGALGRAAADTTLSRTEAAVVLGICILAVLSLYRSVLKACFETKIIVLLPIYATISALWSQDAMLSLRNGLYLFINTCFAVYLLKKFHNDQLPRLMMFVGTIVTIVSVVLVIGFPAYGLDHQGHEGAWQGLFSQKNTCAQAMVFLLGPAFAIEARGHTLRLLRALYVVAVAGVVIQTESRTGIMIAVLYLAFLAALKFIGHFQGKDKTLFYLAGFTIVGAGIMLVLNYLPAVLALLGRNAGLTGRSQIWGAAFESIMKHPLLGYGYAAFWSVLNGEMSNVVVATGWVVTGAHNGFLNVWIELGAVGLALVTATFIKAGKDAITCLRPNRSRSIDWYIGILFLTILYNLDERTLAAQQNLMWGFFIIACVGLSETARKVRTTTPLAMRGELLSSAAATGARASYEDCL